MRSSIPDVHVGEEISARWINALLSAVRQNALKPEGSTGCRIIQTAAGTTISVRQPARYVGVVQSGGISARSGSTPGTGSVELYLLNVGGNSIVDSTQAVTVFSFSSTTGGIASGTYCWVEEDIDGNFWITAVDCGN